MHAGLKAPSCGQVLASNRRGWYQFRESIMRGYVRLRAEEKGLELALDYALAPPLPPHGDRAAQGVAVVE